MPQKLGPKLTIPISFQEVSILFPGLGLVAINADPESPAQLSRLASPPAHSWLSVEIFVPPSAYMSRHFAILNILTFKCCKLSGKV